MDKEFEKFMGNPLKDQPVFNKKEVIVDLTPFAATIHKSGEKEEAFGSSNKQSSENSMK